MFHRITPRVPGTTHLWRGPSGTVEICPPFLTRNTAVQRIIVNPLPVVVTGNAYGQWISGGPGSWTQFIQGSGVSGNSWGQTIQAGTTSGDRTWQVANYSGTVYGVVFGDGSGSLGYNGTTQTLTWNAAGNGTWAAPATGAALTINGAPVASAPVLQLNGSNTAGARGLVVLSGTTGSADYALIVNDAPNVTNLLLVRANGAFGIGVNALTLSGNSSGNMTAAAPSGGDSITLTGLAAGRSIVNSAGTALLQNATLRPGLVLNSSGADFGMMQNDAANTWSLAYGTSSTALGTPALQWKTTPQLLGRGPVAAALVDMTPDTGTFTGSLTGFAANQNVSCHWVRMGNVVMLFLTLTTAANNSTTTMTMTGLPAAIQPASAFSMGAILEDNGIVLWGNASFAAGSGTITFGKNIGTTGGFAATAGIKGIAANQWLCYALT